LNSVTLGGAETEKEGFGGAPDGWCEYPVGLPGSWAEAGTDCDRQETHLCAIFAGFAALLHRYTSQNSMSLGVRTSTGEESAGPGGAGFIDKAVTVSFSDFSSFQELLDQAARSGAFLDGSVRSIAPRTVQLVAPVEVHRELSSIAAPDTVENHCIRLAVHIAADGLNAALEYQRYEFAPYMIEQLARHFGFLVEELQATPSARIAHTELIRGAERTRLFMDWNNTVRTDSEASVPEMFAAQVRRTPDSTALISGNQRVSFRQLNERANRLAHLLRKLGVGPEVLVGFCFETSVRAVVAILGIIKAGGVYVPLDPEHPTQRLSEIIKDTGLSIVVTDRAFRSRVPPEGILFADLDERSSELEAEPGSDLDAGCTPDSALYIAYTSGSTGRPNGVIGIHRCIINGLHETLFDHEGTDEVSCLNGSVSVVFSVLGLFLPLLCGVPLVVMSPAQYKDPLLLANVIDKERVTNLVLPTPALRQLLSLGERVSSRLRWLRLVMVGGAVVTPELIAKFFEQLPGCRLNKGYGSSEIGGIATKGPAAKGNSVGRPISNTSVFVLDPHMNPVPPGVTGEVCVAARHLARGYLNQPELTAAKFVRNPFSVRPGDRLLRTGDLGRHRPNGELEFLGRADDQVKIRGYRVQLGEIEAVISGHEAVQEVAVTAREVEGELRIIAYAVIESAKTPTVKELRDYVRVRLPEHMVPFKFLFVDSFPRTASGKVDVLALPAPGAERPDLQSEYVAARDPVEAFLVDLWEKLLRSESIGIHDDFLELGGDSLFATLVTAHVWEQFGVELTQVSLFQCPTIAELAAQINPQVKLEAARTVGTADQLWVSLQEK
jgi:amino acid adenylation domain-containing protein